MMNIYQCIYLASSLPINVNVYKLQVLFSYTDIGLMDFLAKVLITTYLTTINNKEKPSNIIVMYLVNGVCYPFCLRLTRSPGCVCVSQVPL